MMRKRSGKLLLEVCVDSVESAIAAQKGGAGRIELCANIASGGITPSAGMITAVRTCLSIGLHVMIRPRGGDFCYSPAEFSVMQRDIIAAKKFGADGVVFGILNSSGSVDVGRTRSLANLAHPLSVTFHRAFDAATDPLRALEEIISIGINRILTSGQAATAVKGVGLIGKLIRQAGPRIIIMPGSGVTEKNVQSIIGRAAVSEIHSYTGVSRKVRGTVTADAIKVRRFIAAMNE
jgi:copper homeostasis protein